MTQATETAALAPVAPSSVAPSHHINITDTQGINAFSSEKDFATAQRIAKALASSTIVPSDYRNNIPNVLIALELAGRIGASVFAVMQNMHIINGRPSWSASFLIATVNTSCRFTPLRFRWERDKQGRVTGCRAVARDRENNEECEGALITMQMAHAEGWYEKKGSKWQTMPEQMLMYRAAGFWARVYAPELSLGMHTREEIEDITPPPAAAEPVVVQVPNRPQPDDLMGMIEASGPLHSSVPKQRSPNRSQKQQKLPSAHPDAEPPYEEDLPYDEEPPQ